MDAKEFATRHKIRATAKMVDANPNMTDFEGYHYKVTLTRRNGSTTKRLTVFFSMGYGHSQEPEAADVLDCLASDAAGVHNATDFEDWAGEYGYDTDSRKAERTYAIVQRQAEKLQQFLGWDLYHDLLWDSQRV